MDSVKIAHPNEFTSAEQGEIGAEIYLRHRGPGASQRAGN
jgi:hypothetical protein